MLLSEKAPLLKCAHLTSARSADSLSIRLIYSDTRRNAYADKSAIAEIGVLNHQLPQCAWKRPVESPRSEIQNSCCRRLVSKI